MQVREQLWTISLLGSRQVRHQTETYVIDPAAKEKDLILRRPLLLMAGLPLLGFAAPAFAGEYRYSHKAGVSASMIETEESECFEAAKLAMHKPSAPNPYNPATQSTAAGAAGAALAHGFGRGLEGGRAFKATYFNCLRIKGYTQRAMPSAEWKALKKLPKKERREKLTGIMSSLTPEHPEMSPDEYD